MKNTRFSLVEPVEVEEGEDLPAGRESQPSSKSAVGFDEGIGAERGASKKEDNTSMGKSISRELHNRQYRDRRQGQTVDSMAERREGMSISLLSSRLEQVEEGEEEERGGRENKFCARKTYRTTILRNDAAFWLLGLINNSGSVIMMAVAKEIAPGAVGVVFLANVAPTILLKISAPYW